MGLQLPKWAGDPALRSALWGELSAFRDDVGRLRHIANQNATEGIETGVCLPEPALRVPRLVRRLAAENDELREAIESCKCLGDVADMSGGVLGWLAIPDPVNDRDRIENLSVASERLGGLIGGLLSHLESGNRMSPGEIAERADGLLAARTKAGKPIRSKNELARVVGCSPNARAIKSSWEAYEKAIGASAKPKAERLHDGIGSQDEQLQRLIEEQEKDDRSMPFGRRSRV